ncbi:MAG TPA: SDR family oxidoreductase [Candidatus Dormibacteraeota bacterium]|nr:SDR family oxidoreductase [Candidatus Dormibacteraeota bacterium]
MNLLPANANPLSIFRLDGKVALLSGATGLLGRPMAQALAGAGAHVIVNSRRQTAVEALVDELKNSGLSASGACFDVTDEAAVRTHVELIGKTHGRLDVLVNNASSGRPGTIESATIADFEYSHRVNVLAAFQIIQCALPLLKQAGERSLGGASVINVASMYGSISPDPRIYGTSGANNPPYYGAAKAGLIQLTRYTACHLAPERIRVNCISPGPFPNKKYLEQDPGFHDRLKDKNPMHRTGDPCELQGPLLFLASDASSYVTGINLAVDGGWTAW